MGLPLIFAPMDNLASVKNINALRLKTVRTLVRI